MQSEFRLMDGETPIEFSKTVHDERLGALIGRPFNFGSFRDKQWLVIWRDNGKRHVAMHVTDKDLEMSDDDFKRRIIAPAVNCLDNLVV